MTRHAACLALLLVLPASAAPAQERRWEVEVYGGAIAARTASQGRQTLPAAGAPIVTSNPLFPSREVPSWFFGDGAALLNAVNEEFGGASRITPLDSLFASAKGGRTGVAGVRLRRLLSPTAAVEIAADFLGSAPAAPPDVTAAVESARRSFGDTFAELLRGGPFTSIVIDATADVSDDARREMSATAAFNTDVGRLGPLIPYLTFGGGIVAGIGALPAAQLAGRYRFSVLGQVPIDESDRVTIAFERPLTYTAVVGGGLHHNVSEGWSIRFDVRAVIGPDTARVRVSADPATQQGGPAGFVESGTTPSIQFSNDPSVGRRSSLSAAALEGFTVFDGGIRTRTLVTFGIARRF